MTVVVGRRRDGDPGCGLAIVLVRCMDGGIMCASYGLVVVGSW